MELEESLIIKDGLDIDEKKIQKKLSKMRIEREQIEECKSCKFPYNIASCLRRPVRMEISRKSLKMEEGATLELKEKKKSSTMLIRNTHNTLSLFSPDKTGSSNLNVDKVIIDFKLDFQEDNSNIESLGLENGEDEIISISNNIAKCLSDCNDNKNFNNDYQGFGEKIQLNNSIL